ncbi:unnamed protein product [Parnassius apollo]|uniref:(apollo) hypothetical protein n=1 Tax=Parnassius apollo TaxID=110799 RepID=A0A8S3WPQ0_PARAO|nr:unnamed protein product [Parnassius apollo]
MGRGKKKSEKKEEQVPSLSSLSIAEEPSTSQAQPVTEPPVSTQPTAKEPDEENTDGLGLGLEGSKKRRPRKKKDPASVARTTSGSADKQAPDPQPAVVPPETRDLSQMGPTGISSGHPHSKGEPSHHQYAAGQQHQFSGGLGRGDIPQATHAPGAMTPQRSVDPIPQAAFAGSYQHAPGQQQQSIGGFGRGGDRGGGRGGDRGGGRGGDRGGGRGGGRGRGRGQIPQDTHPFSQAAVVGSHQRHEIDQGGVPQSQVWGRGPPTQPACEQKPSTFWGPPPRGSGDPQAAAVGAQAQVGGAAPQTQAVSVSQQQQSSGGQSRGRGPGRMEGNEKDIPQATQTPGAMTPQPAYSQPPSKEAARTSPTLSLNKMPLAIRRSTVPVTNIVVLTNYLPMTLQFKKIHRYDVGFKPDKPKKMIPRAFCKAKDILFRNHTLAFDQAKNCYSIHPLPGVNDHTRFAKEVELLDDNGKTMKFEVSFKYTGLVDLDRINQFMVSGGSSLNPPTEAIQCIDVILRQGTLESYVKAGKQFFKRPARPIDLGDGLEMWTGLFQSAIFTSTAFVNIDVAHKGFPKKQSMIDALTRDFRLDPTQPLEQQRREQRSVENFHNFVKGLRVNAVIGGDTSTRGQKREFICNGVVDPPIKLYFTMTHPDGRQQKMSVAEYYLKEKKYRLQYPNLNCLWVGPKNKNIYFPMELLEVVPGQALRKQLNEMQLSKMVREAATPPNIRKQKIEDVIKDMNYSRSPLFKEFGLSISEKFLQVEAKVLQPPKLMVGQGRSIDPRGGVWRSNTVLQPEVLGSWGFIAIEADPRQSNFDGIIEMIMRVGNQMGMRVAPPKCTHFNVRINELTNILFTALERDINFLFIIVSRRGRDYYHRVKRLAELEVGILTQCIKEETASRRMNEQTVRNILLKVNAKLMGLNQALDGRSMPACLKGSPVMIVGADVTHPSPDQSSIPSIAAVTASIDQKCFVYNIELCVQSPKQEIIVDFEDMMVEHMQVFRKRLNTLPKKIYVFRDGVSEGQFDQVINYELSAVYRAYQRLTGTTAKPEVLFLLVQKRHHTRFFSHDANAQNVEPGTVVDKHIVHPKELDFYLVSHYAIKGTARPTRYHAVCNDGGIPLDEVEQLTYYLCHLYSRCTRAVSYPTPTYYAHLACLRAKSLTYGDTFNNEDLERKPKRLHVLKKMLDFSRMFFV